MVAWNEQQVMCLCTDSTLFEMGNNHCTFVGSLDKAHVTFAPSTGLNCQTANPMFYFFLTRSYFCRHYFTFLVDGLV